MRNTSVTFCPSSTSRCASANHDSTSASSATIRWPNAAPNAPRMLTWLAEADEDRVFLSVATLAELRYGIERMAPGRGNTTGDRNALGWIEISPA